MTPGRGKIILYIIIIMLLLAAMKQPVNMAHGTQRAAVGIGNIADGLGRFIGALGGS